ISKSAVRSATRKVPSTENSSELATQEGGDGDHASHHAREFRERSYPARDLDPPDRPERSARARSRLLCKPRGQLHRGRDAKGHGRARVPRRARPRLRRSRRAGGLRCERPLGRRRGVRLRPGDEPGGARRKLGRAYSRPRVDRDPQARGCGHRQRRRRPAGSDHRYERPGRLSVSEGDTILVVGANGGVGSFAVQMAADAGATVIAPALPEDEEYLRELGVGEILPREADVAALVHERYPEGIEALLDLVSYAPEGFDTHAEVLHDDGRGASPLSAAGEGSERHNVG